MNIEFPDQFDRDQFVNCLDRNFSVIAPAGVGKTSAIVDRVVNLALTDLHRTDPLLPKLILVTYTRKSANEMFQRAQEKLYESSVSIDTLMHLNATFFGTIHSLCLDLLNNFGYSIGLSGSINIVSDTDSLWNEFIGNTTNITSVLSDNIRSKYLKHIKLEKIYSLVRTFEGFGNPSLNDLPYPNLDFENILNFAANNKTKDSIAAGKKIIGEWQKFIDQKNSFLALPECANGGKEFKRVWCETFQPLHEWLSITTLKVIENLSIEFQNFRISKSQLTYSDLINLSVRLFENKTIAEEIRLNRNWVILDEAQDTDAAQFKLLTEISRPVDAKGIWLNEGGTEPEAGKFCMVGDPQQSIYSSRADLATFNKVHRKLIDSESGEELVFSVTRRCARNIVKLVNDTFPNIMDNSSIGHTNSGSQFTRLQNLSNAIVGQVVKINLHYNSLNDDKKNINELGKEYSVQLASWLNNLTLENLQARDWSNVAVICPRNNWLEALNNGLSEINIKTQLHTRSKTISDNPAFIWLTALVTILAEPENSFEIFGVLREIFGVSDYEMKVFNDSWRNSDAPKKTPHSLQIMFKAGSDNNIANTLNKLVDLRESVIGLSLRESVEKIIDETSLYKRLEVLPDINLSENTDVLNLILLSASKSENDNLTLNDFAKKLRDGFSEKISEIDVKKGHLQLITCHNAKGLEWDAVILPFFFRPISSPNLSYPHYFKPSSGNLGKIIMSKQYDNTGLIDNAKKCEQEELKRILYVSMTRARNSLVLLNDSSFFKKQNNSFADKLLVLKNQKNENIWNELSGEFMNLKIDFDKRSEFVTTKKFKPDSDILDIDKILNHSKNFPKRITPSSLSHESIDYDDEKITINEFSGSEELLNRQQGLNYGNWWHHMMEFIAWDKSVNEMLDYMNTELNNCPVPERGKKEIDLFLKSKVIQLLKDDKSIIKSESPFLWKKNNDEVLEGIIDLVCYNQKQNLITIIDWKTDVIDGKKTEVLVERYKDQIYAYQQALKHIFSKQINAYIYSTYEGKLLKL